MKSERILDAIVPVVVTIAGVVILVCVSALMVMVTLTIGIKFFCWGTSLCV